MGCEESFITMKLIWYGYLILSLGICVHETLTETLTETDLSVYGLFPLNT